MSLQNLSRLTLELPDGAMLIAARQDDGEYPRIAIYLHHINEPDELLCFAEFNSSKPKDGELCISAYTAGSDEPVHYDSYHRLEEV